MDNKWYSSSHDLLTIWGQLMTMPLRFSFLLILVFALSACGLAVTPAPFIPTKVPPTPFSTHLPPVETAIPAGFDANNPIRLVIVGNSTTAANALEDELNALLAVAVDVVLVDSQGEAMTALCASSRGQVSAAWLNGATYPAALQCGVVSLQAELGNAEDSDTGEAGVVVVNAEFAEEGGLPAAVAENFCRISVSDFYGWLLPQMLFAAEGIDPSTIADVNEYPDNAALLAALNSGECAALGLTASDWEAVPEVTPEAGATPEEDATPVPVPTVVATSAQFPYQIMVFPFAADLQVINEITSALLQIDMATGRSGIEVVEAEGTPDPEATAAPEISMEADDLTALFGNGYFVPVTAADFAELDAFLESTGLNFAEIGQ